MKAAAVIFDEAPSLSEVVAFDQFAGHGWGVACKRLGIREYGVEIMPEAQATRAANGMETIYADVWEGLERPELVPPHTIQIGSPPCPTFSSAGKGEGRRAIPTLLAAIDDRRYESVASLRALAEEVDPESALVLVPLAHAFVHRPQFIVLEQVREVLPIWQKYAEVLRSWGYSAWAGILYAEQYGVPQSRRRAVLIARRDGRTAVPPRPTHSRYYEREPERLDPGVEAWATMEDALGWNVPRPAPTVTGGGLAPAGPSRSVAAVATPFARRLAVVSNYGSGGDPSARGIRNADEPAATITSKAGRSIVRVVTGQNSQQAGGATKRYSRKADLPSPTVTGQARSWRFAGAGRTALNTSGQRRRPLNEPAATITGGATAAWVKDVTEEGVNLTYLEAAILQSYPADFIWEVEFVDAKGRTRPVTKGAIFQQVGNAVPPLLAEAILRSLLADPEPGDEWTETFAGLS